MIYRHADPASVDALTRDDELLVISHSEHGDPRYPALRVLRTPNDRARGRRREVGRRGPRPARAGVRPAARRPPAAGRPRAPRPRGAADLGRRRRHRDRDRAGPARRRHRRLVPRRLRAAGRATTTPPAASCTATTWPPARWRSWTPRPGVVRGATARPDGTVELAWSSSELPPVVRRADGPVVLSVTDEEPPAAYPVEDRWVPGPGGDVHALLVRPGRRRPRTRRRSWCTAAPRRPTTTPTAPAGRPTSTPGTRSCT